MRFPVIVHSPSQIEAPLPTSPRRGEVPERLRLPYGIADFQSIREEGYFYVDRTDRIPLICRPLRYNWMPPPSKPDATERCFARDMLLANYGPLRSWLWGLSSWCGENWDDARWFYLNKIFREILITF